VTRTRWIVLALVLAAGTALVAGCGGGGEQADQAQLYTCGMHPEVINEGPGLCPICHMELTRMESPMKPVAAGEERPTPSNIPAAEPWTPSAGSGVMFSTAGGDEPPAAPAGGTGPVVSIDPVVVQNMGVRIAPVVRGSLSRHIRTIGEIEVAEDEISVVNLRYSGWIERIHVDQTGEEVSRGQALFDIYSPELVSAQDEYLLALRTGGDDSPLAHSARARLENWQLSDKQIERIAERGEATRDVTIYAPRSGYVLHKNVVEGARVMAGSDLYRIGELDRIWVLAEVYEFDAPWVALDQPATMELSFTPGETYAGHVSYIYPTLDERSRTLKVRLEFPNPGLALRPGMFATVWIESDRRDGVLMIPTEAILQGGDRQTVFVAEGGGHYRAQGVTTGLVGDNRHTEVRSGLVEGEQVVVSGQFLLDSESQLQEAVAKLLAARLEAKQGLGDEHAGHNHADPDPTSYWTCPMHPEVVQDSQTGCPICGMDLVEKDR
jgi:membrane fusion protein, copper/silver efflux system